MWDYNMPSLKQIWNHNWCFMPQKLIQQRSKDSSFIATKIRFVYKGERNTFWNVCNMYIFVQTSSTSSMFMTAGLYRRTDIRWDEEDLLSAFICLALIHLKRTRALFQFKHYEYEHYLSTTQNNHSQHMIITN